MPKPFIIAIDGPAGAGKSTVARLLARRLGFAYVDSGATYRAVALRVLESGLMPDDERGIAAAVGRMWVELSLSGSEPRVLVDGTDVTDRLRSPEVALAAAQVSRLPAVRAKLVEVQRAFPRGQGVVMEGRDIGTVVFPEAALKIFLEADVEERALRRQEQDAREGRPTTLEKTADQIGRRDQLDAARRISPLVPAPDAVRIDSTHLTAEQVVEQIISWAGRRGLLPPPE